jgi:small GTP-binding protein
VDKTRIKVEIWDTAGAEQYEALAQQYWRKAHGAVLVFDVMEAESFARAQQWLEQLRDAKGRAFPVQLCANKADLPEAGWAVSRAAAQRWAQEQQVPLAFTSARTGQQVDEAFAGLAARIPIPNELAPALVLEPNNKPPPAGGAGDSGCPC